MENNISQTAEYVSRYGSLVVVEGICSHMYSREQIDKLGLTIADRLSKPEVVERFVSETGVDMVVPDVGTEHSSITVGQSKPRYYAEVARKIGERVGSIMVLHGTSSLGDAVRDVTKDGIVKVNFYTAMATGAAIRTYNILRQHEKKLLIERDLAVSSASFFDDIRRRYVAECSYDMLDKLGYRRLIDNEV
jgi:fructose-bisphosphate aldolase class II